MKGPWGFVLGLFIGSVGGSIAGYFIHHKVLKKEQDQLPTYDDVVNFYNQKINEILERNRPKVEETSNEQKSEDGYKDDSVVRFIPPKALEPDGTPKKIMQYQPKVTEKDYKSYNKMYTAKDGNELQIREGVNMEKTDPWPHKITMDEWLQNKNYSKVSLIYYEIDGVFATTGDEPTDYTEEYFGVHNLNEFGASSNSGMGHDAWTLMLRDELTRTDFQILYDGTNSWELVYQNTGGEKN